jgi:hypothetical protein
MPRSVPVRDINSIKDLPCAGISKVIVVMPAYNATRTPRKTYNDAIIDSLSEKRQIWYRLPGDGSPLPAVKKNHHKFRVIFP